MILPLVVLEELDGLKKAEGEKGANVVPLCYQITMSAEECERSELAMDAGSHRL